MNNLIIQIAVLIAAIGIIVVVILAIPILLNLRRITNSLSKASNLIELGLVPLTWGASLIVDIMKKILNMGEKTKGKKEE
jgi:hypothetical protein